LCPRNSLLLLGAFLVHGLRPGPTLMNEHPQLFWGVVTSMYTGNALLLLLNLPLIGIWVRVLKIPYSILFPLIMLFCFVGLYGVSSNPDEIVIMGIFGALGYILKKLDVELAPMILAYLLGPMLESNLRQALIISKGSFGIFFSRPISAGLLLMAAVIFALSILSGLRRKSNRVG
jgi:putative tricarboxylic transport membrane protein